MTNTEQFGDLRALVNSAPSGDTWDALCDALDGWDDDSIQQIVAPYLAAHLDRWPDGLRLAPLRWLERAAARQPVPALSLTRAVCITPDTAPERASLNLQDLSNTAWWAALTELTLASCGLTPDAVALLPSGLRALSLSYNAGLSDAGVERLCARSWPALLALDLSGCKIGDSGLWELAASRAMPRLKRLILRHNAATSEGAFEAVERGAGFAPGCDVETF